MDISPLVSVVVLLRVCGLWDVALDFRVQLTRAVQLLDRVMGHSGRG